MSFSPPLTEESRLETQSPTGFDTITELKTELESFFSDFRWPLQYFKLTDNGLPDGIGISDTDIAALSSDFINVGNAVDGLLEQYLTQLFEPYDISVEPGTTNYPDLTLTGSDLPPGLQALDIKTAARSDSNREKLAKRCCVGTHGEYFNNPSTKTSNIMHPYADYDTHLVGLFIYSINKRYNPLDSDERYVTDIEFIVHEKWRVSSRKSGTGTRNYIGSPTSIPRLRSGDGAFESREDFLEYWRERGSGTDKSAAQATVAQYTGTN